QKKAGLNSGYADEEYQHCGALVLATAEDLYAAAQLIVKVKQPLAQDLAYLREHHILFSYLHLAADPELVESLCGSGLTAIPFESIVDADGHLPLLAPMSQVAGHIATIRGASLLFRNRGGRGVLLGGIEGAEAGRVVVLGAGVAGSHAVAVAAALGARVDVLDLNEDKLAALKTRYPSIITHLSTAQTIETLCVQADLVVGAVLLAGRRAPVVLQQSVVKKMPEGSVIIDIAIDQGGCVENIRVTSSEELCYVEHGVIHSAVPNMPAAVARTSSQSLSSAVLPYVQVLASLDINTLVMTALDQITTDNIKIQAEQALGRAIAIHRERIVDPVLQREMVSV
ncbi:MAG: NAD(P)-binding domain-containing protein, partial [Gammaproteobacteria bacterium]|nr:NAD(P)-binding domain-containing protein [Gammaproteobacteria bacterium]